MGIIASTESTGFEELRTRIDRVLSLLNEDRYVDYKRAESWDNLKKDLAKDIIAMSNVRDGGLIIIGVAENGETWEATGIPPDILDAYDADEMIEHFNKYASPAVSPVIVRHKDTDGRFFLVIQVREFIDTPIVCKRGYEQELRRGAFYIRPLGKAESREIRDSEEMHDLLELAMEKKLRKQLALMERLGIGFSSQRPPTPDESYDSELEGL